jgi:hypothetical protein
LELEPIDDGELQRVKALGYEGGVRVAQAVGSAEGRIQPNDILVGLHVWPTTSMEAVAEILNRDDLAELNPLKFYVIKRPGESLYASETAKDYVESGRITVNFSGTAGDLRTYPPIAQTAAPSAQATTADAAPAKSPTAASYAQVPSYVLPSAANEAELPRTSTVPTSENAAVASTGQTPRSKSDAGVVIRGSHEAMENFMRLASGPQPRDSIGVLKKTVERERRKLEHMESLAANNAVSAGELETQKANYEISIERLKQAERALEYYKLLVELAEAEYQSAVEVNKKVPRAVTEHELRRLKLKVNLAEAQRKALSE